MNENAIYCGNERRWPGVGAASPDRGGCNIVRARYYKYTSSPPSGFAHAQNSGPGFKGEPFGTRLYTVGNVPHGERRHCTELH